MGMSGTTKGYPAQQLTVHFRDRRPARMAEKRRTDRGPRPQLYGSRRRCADALYFPD